MSRYFQISEDDLAEIERLLPRLSDALFPVLAEGQGANRVKVALRRCKAIISDVRWNYGPPSEVHIVKEDSQ